MSKAKSKSICFSEEVSDVPAEEVAGYMWSIWCESATFDKIMNQLQPETWAAKEKQGGSHHWPQNFVIACLVHDYDELLQAAIAFSPDDIRVVKTRLSRNPESTFYARKKLTEVRSSFDLVLADGTVLLDDDARWGAALCKCGSNDVFVVGSGTVTNRFELSVEVEWDPLLGDFKKITSVLSDCESWHEEHDLDDVSVSCSSCGADIPIRTSFFSYEKCSDVLEQFIEDEFT